MDLSVELSVGLSACLLYLSGDITPALAAVHKVSPQSKIQATIDAAQPGDTIEIEPGIYQESLYVDKPNITLRGIIRQGQWAQLDGGGLLNDGVIASGAGFTIENLKITNYKGNGVMTQGADRVTIRRLIVKDTGIYGIYPTLGHHVLVENNVVSGIADAGIYIGMCDSVDVTNNEVFENVAGIEIENSTKALVAHNSVYANTGGILVFALPGLPRKKTELVYLLKNQVYSNNHYNFGAPGSTVSSIPPGSGIIVLAADQVTITGNIIRDHATAGILLVDHPSMPGLTPDPEVDPSPDRVRIDANIIESKISLGPVEYGIWFHYIGRTLMAGNVADGALELLLPKTFDIYTSGTGQEHCLDHVDSYRIKGPSPFAPCGKEQDLKALPTTMLDPPDSKQPGVNLADLDPAPHAAPLAPAIGEATYNAVCSGCHALNFQRIGPPLTEIATKYLNNPQGIVQFAQHPQKVRRDFPEMPPQTYLGETKLLATAEYILKLAKPAAQTN